ncbi:MAG: hypothetical protein ACXWFN_10140 [Solirubrobacterales bacterium]
MRRLLKPLLAAAAASLMLPAAAGASATLSPSTHDFGAVATGSSVTKAFMLATVCDDDPLVIGYTCEPVPEPPLEVAIGASGGFSQTNDCPASMPRDQLAISYCTIWVTYSPGGPGAASGHIATGDSLDGAPSSFVAGVAVARPSKAAKKKRCKKAKRSAKRASSAATAKCLKRKRAR